MNDATRPITPLERPPDTSVRLPGSKSITNRALVAAALAHGTSRLTGALFSDDTRAMVEALRALGFEVVTDEEAATVEITGAGGALPSAAAALDARQSGTTARFLAPLLLLGPGPYRLDGAPQLRARPMAPAIDALRSLGAEVDDHERPGHLPFTVSGGASGRTATVSGDVSSQFLSGLLLAAPVLPGGLRLSVSTQLVSGPYVELTEATMAAFGAAVSGGPEGDYDVEPGGYRATTFAVEPDASAASYFLAAAAITGGRVRVEGLGERSVQGDTAFAGVLGTMGAEVVRSATSTEVRGTGPLQGIEVDMAAISDTAQTLAVVAAFATSPTRVTGVGFIRRKETDRIAAVVRELRRCGVDADEEPDGFVVRPVAGAPHGAVIETYDDHRMAMSFAIIGLRVPGIEIRDPGCVAKTFPGYFDALETLRASLGSDA